MLYGGDVKRHWPTEMAEDNFLANQNSPDATGGVAITSYPSVSRKARVRSRLRVCHLPRRPILMALVMVTLQRRAAEFPIAIYSRPIFCNDGAVRVPFPY